MKTFKRTSLPESIHYNGRIYTRISVDEKNELPLSIPRIMVKVLSSKLKDKLDLHGKPYKPTEWIYAAKD